MYHFARILASMRKAVYRMPETDALDLLAAAPVVHLATTDAGGRPILRTLHGVLVARGAGDGGARPVLSFHGAPAGEKMLAMGRSAVVSAEELVAEIPSYFLDPERACPATTYYRSVMAHGVLEVEDSPIAKARALAALMAKYQPEGGHVPIDAAHPLYRKAVEGVLVVRMSLESIDGKGKLGQNRKPEELAVVLERLWARGRTGDPHAIELVRGANPDVRAPSFLQGPEGARLSCALEPSDAGAAAELLADAYWNDGLSRAAIAEAQRSSSAWVGAHDASGRLVATARALSDWTKRAWVYDVAVDPAWRGRRLGTAVMRLLLDHPAVRGVRTVLLGTKDAQTFYARFGFRDRAELPPRPYASTEMHLVRERDPETLRDRGARIATGVERRAG